MQLIYEWAMPNCNTFDIEPIRKLLNKEVDRQQLWIDPFANKNQIARITNDLNEDYKTTYHLDAIEFLKLFDDLSIDGVLYDPPYSIRQVNECYDKIGHEHVINDSYFVQVKDQIARIVKPGGKVVCCGWNSNGMGKTRGFEKTKLLIVAHGGKHNDTIVTVEKRINNSLDMLRELESSTNILKQTYAAVQQGT
jgi:tRNA1(Val) A37 N6-methylase TrmN6